MEWVQHAQGIKGDTGGKETRGNAYVADVVSLQSASWATINYYYVCLQTALLRTLDADDPYPSLVYLDNNEALAMHHCKAGLCLSYARGLVIMLNPSRCLPSDETLNFFFYLVVSVTPVSKMGC